MSHPLKTGSLLTTAFLAWTALEGTLPRQVHAESMDVDAASPHSFGVTPSPVPQPLIPIPSLLPQPQPDRDDIPFNPVGDIVTNVALPNTLSAPLESTTREPGIAIEVVPFSEPVAAAIEPEIESEVQPKNGAAEQDGAIAPETASDFALTDTTLPRAIPAVIAPTEMIPVDTAPIGTAPTEVGSAESIYLYAIGPAATAPAPSASTEVVARGSTDPAAVTLAPADKSDLFELAVGSPPSPEVRGWFDRQLAETIARQRVQREAQLRENLIATARQYIEQNNIAAAQQISQNPIFLDAERTALQQAIAAARRIGNMSVPTQLEPVTELAKDVARLADRQTWLLNRLPAVTAGRDCSRPDELRPAQPRTDWSGMPTCEPQSPASTYGWLIQAANRATLTPDAADVLGMLPLAVAAPVTSRYGWRTHPIFGDRRFHAGVDFGAPLGTPVHASLSGYVDTSDYLDGYGVTVILESPTAQERHLYAHLADTAVQPGQWVDQGDVIGWVGNTGNSTGPHLHFEIHRFAQTGWTTIDPLSVASQ